MAGVKVTQEGVMLLELPGLGSRGRKDRKDEVRREAEIIQENVRGGREAQSV